MSPRAWSSVLFVFAIMASLGVVWFGDARTLSCAAIAVSLFTLAHLIDGRP